MAAWRKIMNTDDVYPINKVVFKNSRNKQDITNELQLEISSAQKKKACYVSKVLAGLILLYLFISIIVYGCKFL